ncbi:MAG: nucleoside hydrolase [Nocardioidaceae bacterium]
MKIHLDTDFAGDPDDACALAMLLGWRGVEIAGITTVADPDGRRADYVRRLLALTGRTNIPVEPGARVSLTNGQAMGDIPNHDRYWYGPDPQPQVPEPRAALDLITNSLDAGASIAAVGPMTNLALLEALHPGSMRDAPVVAMGGWFDPVPPGNPAWGPSADWNVQCDTLAATTVATHAALTLVPLSTTLRVHLRESDLPGLEDAGQLGQLITRQALAYCSDEDKTSIARAHAALPDDLLNFHHDPLACAVAAGWPGVSTDVLRLKVTTHDGVLQFRPDPDGRAVRVVTDVDSHAFKQAWLAAVIRAGASQTSS